MKNYWFILLLGLLGPLQMYSQNFTMELSNKMYTSQKKKDSLDNAPPLLKRVDKIRQARNHVLCETLSKDLPQADTLFFIEKYESNFVTGQFWGKEIDTIKYIVNFNSKTSILTDEVLFSQRLLGLTTKWDIEQIDSINNRRKSFPINTCFITKVIFIQKSTINVHCHCMNLNF